MIYAPFTNAVKDFFRRAVWNGQPVPAVFAGPDRAFSEMEREMERRAGDRTSKATGGQGITKQQTRERGMWTPFFSIFIQPFSFDATRFNPRSFRGVTRNIQTGTATRMRYPRPVAADVQVDLWADGNGGWVKAQTVAAQIELQFVAESIYLPINWDQAKLYKPPARDVLAHAAFYAATRFRLINNGWQDTSDLESGEGAKIIRWTWSGRVEGFLPYRPDEARLVRSVEVDVIDDSDPAQPVLDTLITQVED